FTLDGDDLRVADGALLDLGAAISHDVIVRIADGGSPALGFDKTFAITVRGAGATPSDFTMTSGLVAENATAGTAIATLIGVLDPTIDITHDFELVDDAGGLFAVVGDELRIADESLLDFETATSHDVTIRATRTDDPALVLDKTFTIAVDDVAEFTFTAIADTPYSSKHFPLVENHLANLPQESQFVVHLGDIKSGSSIVDPVTYFPQVSSLLLTSDKPVFIVLGDNEFNDMPDPDASFSAWKDSFLKFDNNWDHDLGTKYQSGRSENFSFFADDTLFVGLNLVASSVHDPAEWADRSADDLAWIQDRFAQYGATANNAVIFAHASAGHSGYDTFEAGFLTVAQDFQKPILYLMGNDHKWELEYPYSSTPNITQVTLDRTGSQPPLQISITDDPDDPFSTDHNFDGFFV
ncbi:MAG: cadherin repeat domain-containing protein, partial [Gammaproteobacteria bacterium]|nr:cadherin repeat domain-containing protein [Gammaproteobacteria bacterium]